MRISTVIISVFLILMLVLSCVSAPGSFAIKKGVNISHWLSQSDRRGKERVDWFTEKDVKLIADLGFDHIRMPVDEEQLWDESGNQEAEAWHLLNKGLDWCAKYNLRAVVDLHILRSHHFNKGIRPLWTDRGEQDKFIQFWREISAALKNRPEHAVAYELMNEAVTEDPDNWNRLIARAHQAIREAEPDRIIIIGSNRWQSPETFPDLRVPEKDPNIILSFHFYTPMFITHYKASWWPGGQYEGPVEYPGLTVDPQNVGDNFSDDFMEHFRGANGVYTKDTLEAMITEPLKKRDALGLPLYCGEWGCLPTVPRDIRLQWYTDMHDILEKHNIAWAIWDYKGSFGIFEDGQVDQDLMDILLK